MKVNGTKLLVLALALTGCGPRTEWKTEKGQADIDGNVSVVVMNTSTKFTIAFLCRPWSAGDKFSTPALMWDGLTLDKEMKVRVRIDEGEPVEYTFPVTAAGHSTGLDIDDYTLLASFRTASRLRVQTTVGLADWNMKGLNEALAAAGCNDMTKLTQNEKDRRAQQPDSGGAPGATGGTGPEGTGSPRDLAELQ